MYGITNTLLIFLSATSVGWMAGLSASPVAATIISALMSAIVAVGAGLTAFKLGNLTVRSAFVEFPTIPVAAIAFGMALGVAAGVWSRTHDVLSPTLESRLNGWVALGAKREDVVRAMLAQQYSKEGKRWPRWFRQKKCFR
jgi:hypothetical protein